MNFNILLNVMLIFIKDGVYIPESNWGKKHDFMLAETERNRNQVCEISFILYVKMVVFSWAWY